jgi:hypothetical protein
MADQIVKRVPANKPTKQYERSPTAEVKPQLRHGLIDEDAELHGKLEPKLELVDAPSGDRPDGAGSSPSRPGPRLAHTLRRGPRRGAVLSAVPAPPIHRPDPSTPAMPRRERPAPLAIPRLYSGSDEEAAATVVAQYAPSVVTRLMPRSAHPVAHLTANTASPGTVPGAAQRAARRTAINAVPRGATRPLPEAAPKGVINAAPKAVINAAPKAVFNAAPEAVINALPEAVIDAAPKAMINALPDAVIDAVTHAPDPHAISTPGSDAAPDFEPITPNLASARLLAAFAPSSAPDSRPLTACPAEAHLIAVPASGAAPDSKPLTAHLAGARVLAALRRLPSTVAARFEARGAGAANLPILRDTWRSRLVVPAALLVALGTVSLLLRAIL